MVVVFLTHIAVHHVASVGQSAGSVTVNTCESAYMGRVLVLVISWPLLRGPWLELVEFGRAMVTSPPLPRAEESVPEIFSVPSSEHPVRG